MQNTTQPQDKNRTQARLDELVNKTEDLNKAIGAQVPIEPDKSLTVANGFFTTQYATSDNSSTADMTEAAKEAGLSTVDLGNCTEILKDYYKISSVVIAKVDLDSKLNLDNINNPLAGNSVKFRAYNNETKEQLNISVCDEEPVKIAIPLPDASVLDMKLYQMFSQEYGIDIFNASDPAFTSRCNNFVYNGTDADTTLNYRRTYVYQNKTANCMGSDCYYGGIDSDNYMGCNCKNMQEDSAVQTDLASAVLAGMPVFNMDIAGCGEDKNIKSYTLGNVGFYITAGVIGASMLVFTALHFIESGLIMKNLDNVIKNDCQFFDKNAINVDRYFQRRDKPAQPHVGESVGNNNVVNNEVAGGNMNSPIGVGKTRLIQVQPRLVGKPPESPKSTNLLLMGGSNDHKSDDQMHDIDNTKTIDHQFQDINNETGDVKISRNNSIIASPTKLIQRKPQILNMSSNLNTPDVSQPLYLNESRKESEINNYIMLNQKTPKEKLVINNFIIKEAILDNEKDFDLTKENDLFVIKINKKIIDEMRLREEMDKLARAQDILNINTPITNRDYEQLSVEERVQYDKRPFCILFWEGIKKGHDIISLFFRRSLIHPFFIRCMLFSFTLSMTFAMNAVLYDDTYIDKRRISTDKDKVFNMIKIYILLRDFFTAYLMNFPRVLLVLWQLQY
jgi:hypothetical protein